jgi:hypothetical protein
MCGANGTPAAVVVLTEQERETVVAAGEVVAGVGAAVQDCAAVRGWLVE